MQNPWGSEGHEGEDVVVIDSEMEEMPHAVRLLVRREAKAQQQQPQSSGQPPTQEMCVMREYIPAELTDLATKF